MCQNTPMNYDILSVKNYFTFDKILKLAYKNKTSPDFTLDFSWYKNFLGNTVVNASFQKS